MLKIYRNQTVWLSLKHSLNEPSPPVSVPWCQTVVGCGLPKHLLLGVEFLLGTFVLCLDSVCSWQRFTPSDGQNKILTSTIEVGANSDLKILRQQPTMSSTRLCHFQMLDQQMPTVEMRLASFGFNDLSIWHSVSLRFVHVKSLERRASGQWKNWALVSNCTAPR